MRIHMNTTRSKKSGARVGSLGGRLTGLCACCIVANASLVAPAYAYIDPGTGTMILQVMGALFASALFYMRSIRLWIAGKLGIRRAPEPGSQSAGRGRQPDEVPDAD